jgi:hypothetical protein
VANPTLYNASIYTPPKDLTSYKSLTLLTIEHFKKLVKKLIKVKSLDLASNKAKPSSLENA